MASRFVSGGRIDAETGEDISQSSAAGAETGVEAAALPSRGGHGGGAGKGSAEWEAVERELEAERRRRDEARAKAVEEGGEKTLYDILQANKAAKQAAFEEQHKLRNQFRALDDDEVDFLDDIMVRRREEEERVKRETREGLEAFRAAQRLEERKLSGQAGEAQGDDEGAGGGGVDMVDVDEWKNVGRKRKRHDKREGGRGPFVKRKSSSTAEATKGEGGGNSTMSGKGGDGGEKGNGEDDAEAGRKSKGANSGGKNGSDDGRLRNGKGPRQSASRTSPPKPPASATSKPGLALVAYGSDSDDD
ncbi:hypothetical protein SODALDRAFT_331061 [Sodiomyces alkalinus F11]|uniref:FAM192A/Fyv6 N-terminal domain-containing protein n=1 Tax=Sodiomyces alkalinus (strain CBS 110278 / VKM F-3762 / F11) TaxID=1314773 RepID=A0A3N2Q3L1_SODAK|nr:hypothetical protein SODALDRAFT_331061 [Sodiomyces alkalinus F11]ROT41332.1 hypothetical protein SODALDRAFT_331061 [Sodiomyces alkalinus F11]